MADSEGSVCVEVASSVGNRVLTSEDLVGDGFVDPVVMASAFGPSTEVSSFALDGEG